jgi:hypothetical protein
LAKVTARVTYVATFDIGDLLFGTVQDALERDNFETGTLFDFALDTMVESVTIEAAK